LNDWEPSVKEVAAEKVMVVDRVLVVVDVEEPPKV
jgi:hypothetical protein